MTKDPFTWKEVRQALNYAVNKEELSEGLYNGNMVPAGGVLPPVDWAYNPDLKSYPYDPDKARELLPTAGYDESNPLTFTFMAYTIPRGYNPVGDRLATAIQEYWSEVGVEAEIQTEEWTQYRADRRADKFQCSLSGWQGDNGDPDNFLYALLGECQQGRGQYRSFYENPEVDDLLEQAQEITDQEERKSALPPGRAAHRRRCAVGLPGLPEASGRDAGQHHRLSAAADLHLLPCRCQQGVGKPLDPNPSPSALGEGLLAPAWSRMQAQR